MKSMIYTGKMSHARKLPRAHKFSYDISMLYLNLDDIEGIINQTRFWSYNKRNLASFYRKDYFKPQEACLKVAVKEAVKEDLNIDVSGKIFLLTHCRYLGILFNPVSFYYCFDKENKLLAIVAEITNTPWLERHHYSLDCRGKSKQHMMDFSFNKEFHVSPFMDLKQHYQWYFSSPKSSLHVVMKNYEDKKHLFTAQMHLQATELTSKALDLFIVKYPFMTLKVITGIYYNALKLNLKKTPFYEHPHNELKPKGKNYATSQ